MTHPPGEPSLAGAPSGPCLLDHRDVRCAGDLVALQRAAYRVEAELIGSHAIPALDETADEVMGLDLQFLAFTAGGAPVAALGYRVAQVVLDLDRLVVHPDLFRRGLARRLLATTLASVPHRVAVVSTGAANSPARQLYLGLGFHHVADREVAPGLLLSSYERTSSSA